MSSKFQAAWKYAISELKKCGGAEHKLPVELQTVLAINNVQGIIDNGGLHYLFESDFHNKPPYQYFVDAYRRIGAERCADALQSAVSLFQCDAPHLDCEHRNNCLSRWSGLEGHPFWSLDSSFDSESDVVWQLAEEYVCKNRKAYKFA